MATNLKEDKVMMGFSIAFIIIVLIVLYSFSKDGRRVGQDIGKYKRAITPWKGGELWWEQLKKGINIRNAGLYLQKRSLREN